eukprot:7291801-Prymnesium_polylepis.2
MVWRPLVPAPLVPSTRVPHNHQAFCFSLQQLRACFVARQRQSRAYTTRAQAALAAKSGRAQFNVSNVTGVVTVCCNILATDMHMHNMCMCMCMHMWAITSVIPLRFGCSAGGPSISLTSGAAGEQGGAARGKGAQGEA